MQRVDKCLENLVLRARRQRLALRSLRKGLELRRITPAARSDGAAVFACIRDEALRLPDFLDHYRRLGAAQFYIADNGSTDGSAALLAAQPDVSLWAARGSYRRARFGMDWLGALKRRHGCGRWCLTVDADELLIYPDWETRPLPALCAWLDARGLRSLPALLLDLHGGPGAAGPGGRILDQLPWFDSASYRAQRDPRYGHDWIQGGPRERAFFAADPRAAPALNKVPLVRWKPGQAYVSSTHHLLPRGLNLRREEAPTGVLLHTKLLPGLSGRAAREAERGEHYRGGAEYRAYLQGGGTAVALHHPGSRRFSGWRQLEALGLMSRGLWA
ncbi:glycosyltransferase family 2 protein [Poseidonocella sp. HB161398]|uniref:glycosyltransferase family 2 protein n=1 Tax=Poseidonocella sp. HB161398 TaxID=2320855 RepID=UPI001F0F0C5A|nr:glycosyltransferase family 2 protein [Poseidonocella sp. HB161398]